MSAPPPAQERPQELLPAPLAEGPPRRKLTLLDATLLVMGGIVGVGIFFNPHQIASRVPSAGAYLALWVFGGVVAIAAGLTFAELGATFPRAGGWFVYLRAAFGRPLAFVFAWVVLCVQSTGAIASIAKFCAQKVHDLAPGRIGPPDSPSGTAVAALLVVAVTAVALTGVKRAARVQNACMLTKLLVIAALIVGGLAVAGDGTPAVPSAPGTGLAPGSVLLALLPLFYTFGGWQLVGYIAPEIENPTRNVPRAVVLGVLGVVVIYLAVNASVLAVLGIGGLAGDASFAATLSERAFGTVGRRWLDAGMCVSAFGICAVNIIVTPWLFVAMAREGLFFESVGKLDERTGVPARALLLQAAIAGVYLFFSLGFLVDSVVFVEWFFHLLTPIGLLLLRARQPELPRPYRSPFYPLAPLVYVAAACIVVGGTLLQPEARVIRVAGVPVELRVLGISIFALGAVLYRPWRALVERGELRRGARDGPRAM